MIIRTVVFDLGHTLWDIGPSRGALERAYAALRVDLMHRLGRGDVPPAADLQRAVGDALRAASETYFMNGDRVDQPPSWTWVDQGLRAAGLSLDATLVRELTPPLFATEIDALVCADGTRDAVAALHTAGYGLGCVTNTLADTAAIHAMLRKHGFEELMASVVVSADEGWRKPHPSLFEKALRQLGAAPGQALFVGDSPAHDIAGAKAVGMYAVLTRQYVTRPVEGFVPPPDAVIDHVRELPEVIRRIERGVR
ncbi:MAG TPA: HAD family hydrolase [Dehalococcoidia bacterium]|nr:HAD family hydrolase [Dehalococcoidia bacterium]